MAQDSIGNVLGVGELVQVELPNPRIMGYVAEITQGGIITGLRQGGQKQTPGMVRIVATFDFMIDPTHPVLANLVRLVDPRAKDQSEPVTIDTPALAN